VFTPLSIESEYERVPWATLTFLLLMAGGTTWAASATYEELAPFLFTPTDVQPWQSLTSLFLHADWRHFFGNALSLWVFGRYVEERLGPARFAVLVIAFGYFADAFDLLRGASLPSLGASGAIAGLMTLTLFQAPRARLSTNLAWWLPRRLDMSVWIYVGLWLVLELWAASHARDSGVAHGAHLGGALAGCLAAWALRSRRLKGTRWWFPRELGGGAKGAESYERLMQSEAMWRTIHEHQRRRREGGDAGP
jgi:membrane associated rhomboid family serine protease